MESERIAYIKQNIYIPSEPIPKRPAIPARHPSLILNDKEEIVGQRSECGCTGGKCIKENACWIYGPNGEVSNPNTDCTSTEAYHFKTLSHDSIGRQL